jgi:hypothetical protein
MENVPDLWPDEIGRSTVRAAITTLKEQAAALGGKTQNLVLGDIQSSDTRWPHDEILLTHRFHVVAPSIHYRTSILEVGHRAEELYPVFIKSDFLEMETTSVADEGQLVENLRHIFSHAKTITLIQALIAQSS